MTRSEACTVPPSPAYSCTVPATPTPLPTRPQRRRGNTRFRKSRVFTNRPPRQRPSRLAAKRRVVLLGPFGEPLTTPTGVGLEMPFRFSTKYQDAETGLLYYGYRYYDPITGRWPSRDPSAEEGGINLYGAMGNAPVNYIDCLGLEWFRPFRTGKARSDVGGDCGDTVRDLAKKLRLDPAEYKKWLKPAYAFSDPLPSSVDAKLTKPSVFTVPNTVVVSYGDTRPNLFAGLKNSTTGVIDNLKEVASDYAKEGYSISHLANTGTNGTDLSLIQAALGGEDVVIWAHGGHGSLEGLGVNSNATLGWITALNIKQNHKFSEVILYACYQGNRSNDWLTLIAPGGHLRAWTGLLKAGRNSDLLGGTNYEDLQTWTKK